MALEPQPHHQAAAHGKNIAPRVAAKLDVARLFDIPKVDSPDAFERHLRRPGDQDRRVDLVQIIDGMPEQAREVTRGQGANLVRPALLRRLDRRNPGYDA